jgi:hypothetical protein
MRDVHQSDDRSCDAFWLFSLAYAMSQWWTGNLGLTLGLPETQSPFVVDAAVSEYTGSHDAA